MALYNKHGKRSLMIKKIIQGCAILLPPILLIWMTVAEFSYGAVASILVVVLALVPFFLEFERQKPRPRDLVPIAVMSAIGALGRALFAAVPSFKPTSAIVIITGMQFGPQAGFLTGTLSALASNMFLGQGPWTPWQMYAWGIMGYVAGWLEQKGAFQYRTFLYSYGLMAGVLFGWFMNLWYVVGYVRPITATTIFIAYGSSMVMDMAHGISTVLFLVILEKPWGKKLKRLKFKYGICNHGGDDECT